MNNTDELVVQMLKPPKDYIGAITELVTQGWGQCFGIHRDSDTLSRANWDSIIEELQDQVEDVNESYRVEGSHHWLAGLSDTMLCRILDCECEDWEDSHIVRHPDWESKGNKFFICHVCNKTAKITPIFGTVLNIKERLEEYPVLDEEKYSEMENDELMEYLEQEVGEESAEALAKHLYDEYSVSRVEDVSYEWIERWKA